MTQIAVTVEKIELTFQLSNGGVIKITEAVVKDITSYIQKDKKDTEAGGILMGRFIKNSKNIIIDKITEPMRGDLRTRYTFKRASPAHQKILDQEWEKSKGTCNYLGEWHTHPEEKPEPSGVDKRDWKRKLKTDEFSSRYLYFIILGIEEIAIWEGDRRTLDIIKLKILTN